MNVRKTLKKGVCLFFGIGLFFTCLPLEADAGLIAHWTFDYGVTSEVNSENLEVTVRGTPVITPEDAAVGRGCLLLDNSTESISGLSVSNADLLSIGSGSWTVSFWMKRTGRAPSATGEVYGTMLASGWNMYLQDRGDPREIRAYCAGALSSNPVRASYSAPTGSWSFVAVVFDRAASRARIYRYDLSEVGPQLELESEMALQSSYDVSFDEFTIGYLRNADPTLAFDGCLDDIRIYDTALNEADITGLTVLPESMEQPVAHWTFDDGMDSDINSGTFGVTARGAPVITTEDPAVGGGCLLLDNSTSPVSGLSVANADLLSIGSNSWTVSFWMKRTGRAPTATGDVYGTALASGWNLYLQDRGSPREIRAYCAGALSSNPARASYSAPTGSWSFVAVVFDQAVSNARIYRYDLSEAVPELQLETEAALQSGYNVSFSEFTIGYVRDADPTGAFDGCLDDIRIYNFALSETEVSELAQNPKPSVTPVDLYVSPQGDDRNSGTSPGTPLRTAERARDTVRLLNQHMNADIRVNFSEGEYILNEPLLFNTEDSGFNGHRVIYRSVDGIGTARFRGSEPVTGWTPYSGDIWVAAVTPGKLFHTMYENGHRVYKARYPNCQYDSQFATARAPYLTSEDGSDATDSTSTESWLTYRAGDFDPVEWGDIGTMKINVFPWNHRDWHRWILNVTQVDAASRRLTFANMGDQTEIGPDARYFLEDHPAFLDVPGEFYLSADEGLLYYIPLGSEHPDNLNITVPRMLDLFRLQGDSSVTPITGLTFEGLDLGETDGYAPARHWWIWSWGKTDHALVWMNLTRDVQIINCRLANSGRHGLIMAGGNLENRVEGCLIEETGISGIELSNRLEDGPDQGLSNPNERHVLTNNRIRNVGQLALYAECIGITSSSSNEVSYSDLCDSPRYAITMRGNTTTESDVLGTLENLPPSTDNVFRYLRVYNCGQDSGDMGALHAAGVNIDGGPYINVFEQISLENIRAVPGMADQPPNGIFFDWPSRTMNQVLRNISATNVQGAVFRSNRIDNENSTVYENVSWLTGFDESAVDFDNIGVRADYPAEFGGHSLGVLVDGTSPVMLPVNSLTLDASVVIAPHLTLTGTATYVWSLVSGPGEAEFTSSTNAQTRLILSRPGTYTFRVQVMLDGYETEYTANVLFNPYPVSGSLQSFDEWTDQNEIPLDKRDPQDDPFDSGLKNLTAYATGLPQDGTGQTPLDIRVQNGLPMITFPWRTDIDSNTYFAVESSDNLTSWQLDGSLQWESGLLATNRIEFRGRPTDDSGEKRFYRIYFGF